MTRGGKMKTLATRDLIPGMITEEDIYSYDGNLILAKGSILTDNIITRLEFYSVLRVKISNNTATISATQFKKSTYSQKIQSKKDFKIFKKDFLENVASTKYYLNEIVQENLAVEPDKLIKNAINLMPEGMTTLHLFDMLHSLREQNDETYVHSLNVALICNVMGRWLKFSDGDIQLLTLCGMLHDIGKTVIPDRLLKKPAKLTDLEYQIIKTHTLKGFDILKNLDLDPHVMRSALMHHERCDGSGYPSGLTANRIDSFAKIVAIADVYDAMTSARIYRGPICPFKVVEIFQSEGLQKYDPHYLLTFLEGIVLTYMNNTVLLSNGLKGDVVMINKLNLSRPVIKVDDNFIDLSKTKDIYIESLL